MQQIRVRREGFPFLQRTTVYRTSQQTGTARTERVYTSTDMMAYRRPGTPVMSFSIFRGNHISLCIHRKPSKKTEHTRNLEMRSKAKVFAETCARRLLANDKCSCLVSHACPETARADREDTAALFPGKFPVFRQHPSCTPGASRNFRLCHGRPSTCAQTLFEKS